WSAHSSQAPLQLPVCSARLPAATEKIPSLLSPSSVLGIFLTWLHENIKRTDRGFRWKARQIAAGRDLALSVSGAHRSCSAGCPSEQPQLAIPFDGEPFPKSLERNCFVLPTVKDRLHDLRRKQRQTKNAVRYE